MTHVPSDFSYSRDHEWVQSLDNGRVRVGITDYAQKRLGDLVWVRLPEVGSSWEAGDNFSLVESVKSLIELYMPVAGTIAAVNESLADTFGPDQISDDPYGDGWIAEVKVANATDLQALLTPAQYKDLIGQ
ncbi:glycine cleavage system protein GcvH [Streptomyces sp. NPDC047108]|uniref:glycine cleavage system protein GcvH n=1 Tax=Streptomyces sp. NPDC047108 TaxID=3155025 RepID=UPI0033C2E273